MSLRPQVRCCAEHADERNERMMRRLLGLQWFVDYRRALAKYRAGEGPRRLWTRRPQWGRGRRAGVEQGLLMLLGTVPAGVAYWACLVLDDARLRVVGRAMFPAILLFLRHDGV